jgi:phosphopantetheinyl transferase
MGRPVWRDVLEYTQLSPEERAGCLRPMGDERTRSLRLWGRIAAKEAARRLWLARGDQPVFPADLVIEPNAAGRPILRSKERPECDELPSVSLAYTDGVAVGIAASDPNTRVGIDVALIGDGQNESPASQLGPDEVAVLDGVPGHYLGEWRARLWTAKQAVTKTLGRSPATAKDLTKVIDVDFDTGSILVCLAENRGQSHPQTSPLALPAMTQRRGKYVWAWTIARDSDS